MRVWCEGGCSLVRLVIIVTKALFGAVARWTVIEGS